MPGLTIKNRLFSKLISIYLMVIFLWPGSLFAQILPYMPPAGTLVVASEKSELPCLVGMRFNSDDPFDFTFILNAGDSPRTQEALTPEIEKLSRYFIAALAISEKDLWVNLSPYEKNRVSTDELAQTDLGRDMLGEDYILKQLSASLTHPGTDAGKKYWESKPMNNLQKVWISPEKIRVLEAPDRAVIDYAKLKVTTENNDVAFIRYILPVVEQDVNSGKNFSQLRQVYSAIIMATWFKKKLQDTVLGEKYFGKKHIAGGETDDPTIRKKIYDEYVKAFEQGAYNVVKTVGAIPCNRPGNNGRKHGFSPTINKVIKRTYFSGGVVGATSAVTENVDMSRDDVEARTEQRGDVEVDIAGGVLGAMSEPAKMLGQGNYGAIEQKALEQFIADGGKSGYESKLNPNEHGLQNAVREIVTVRDKRGLLPEGSRGRRLYDAKNSRLIIVRRAGLTPQEDAEVLHHELSGAMVEYKGIMLGNGLKRMVARMIALRRDNIHIQEVAENYIADLYTASRSGTAQAQAVHEARKRCAYLLRQLGIYGEDSRGVIEDSEVTLQRYTHILASAKDGADWIKGGHEGILDIHKGDLGDDAIVTALYGEKRDEQRAVIGEFYADEPQVVELSEQYEKRLGAILALRYREVRGDRTSAFSAASQMIRVVDDFAQNSIQLSQAKEEIRELLKEDVRLYGVLIDEVYLLSDGADKEKFNTLLGFIADIYKGGSYALDASAAELLLDASEMVEDDGVLRKLYQIFNEVFERLLGADKVKGLAQRIDHSIVMAAHESLPPQGVKSVQDIIADVLAKWQIGVRAPQDTLEKHPQRWALEKITQDRQRHVREIAVYLRRGNLPGAREELRLMALQQGVLDRVKDYIVEIVDRLDDALDAVGAARRAGTKHKRIDDAFRLLIVRDSYDKNKTSEVDFLEVIADRPKGKDRAAMVAIKVYRDDLPENMRCVQAMRRDGVRVFALRKGMSASEEEFALSHDQGEAALDHVSSRDITALAQEYNLPRAQVVHILQSARERAYHVGMQKARRDQVMLLDIDKKDIDSYEQNFAYSLTKENRDIQRAIVGKFFGVNSNTSLWSKEYEELFTRYAQNVGGAIFSDVRNMTIQKNGNLDFSSSKVLAGLKNSDIFGLSLKVQAIRIY